MIVMWCANEKLEFQFYVNLIDFNFNSHMSIVATVFHRTVLEGKKHQKEKKNRNVEQWVELQWLPCNAHKLRSHSRTIWVR
jgi:hypothetical protein